MQTKSDDSQNTEVVSQSSLCKGESEIASVVINESEEEGEEARKFLEEVRVTFPQVLRVVKTRKATYAVLKSIESLCGIILKRLTDLKKLLRNPPVVKIPKVRDLISTNPFLGALPSTERETLVGSTKEIMKFVESVIVLAKVLLPQVFENMGMPDLRALVAERSTMSTYIRGESFELPHHSIGFLLEGFVRGQDAGELVTSPAALLPSRMDQSSRKSEMSGSRAGSFSHQARSYQVETRARVIMFDIGAFEADRNLRRRSSSFLLYPTEHHSRSLSREHGSLMSWPEHSSMFRGHHNLEATNQQESSLSARAMQLSIFGSKRDLAPCPSMLKLQDTRKTAQCNRNDQCVRLEVNRVTKTGCEDEHIVEKFYSPSTLSFR
nr:SOS1-like protein 1 [Ipomoea batatas]